MTKSMSWISSIVLFAKAVGRGHEAVRSSWAFRLSGRQPFLHQAAQVGLFQGFHPDLPLGHAQLTAGQERLGLGLVLAPLSKRILRLPSIST